MGNLTSLNDPSLYAKERTFTRVEAPPPPAAPAAAVAPPVPVAAPAAVAAPTATIAAPVAAPVAAIVAKPVVTLIPKPAKENLPVAPVKAKNPDGSPELLAKPRSGKGDDLKLIWGVGPALEKMLQKMGVWHFDQIASWSPAELRWVDERLEGFKGRAKRDEWIKQSKKLAKGWRPDSAVGDKPKGRG
jgi:NADH-quinone oxidoreductase subunit E